MAHVFIVSQATFPLHLRYQFAGTHAGDKQQKNIGLFADIARTRPGQRAYFYLLNRGFYGPFKVDPQGKGVWWDKLDPTFLQDGLGLRLIYRVQVVADGTYPLPISEWGALDRYLREPERCIWSLVYRKLKASRGCTPIFPWEDEFLLRLIEDTNQSAGRDQLMVRDSEHLTWDPSSEEIQTATGRFPEYSTPSADHFCVPDDPLIQVILASGRESHLQAFLTLNYGRFRDSEVVFGRDETVAWVGNEVACGLGMQKIDIFVINHEEHEKLFRIIELKKNPPDHNTVSQMVRYVDWTTRFVPGANSTNIIPILLCRNLTEAPLASNTRDSFKQFNRSGSARPLKYIECRRSNDTDRIRFLEVDYE